MTFAGAIIAGGRGTRMGTPHKATVMLPDGTTPVARLARALTAAGCAPLVVVANEAAPYAHTGLRVVPDLRPGCGPLAGIEAALLALAPAPVCVVAGDMAGLRAADLQHLITGWDGRLAVAWTERMQPLCVLIASTLSGEVSAALDRGECAVHRLWEHLGAVRVDFAQADPFTDLDTPEDLARCR